MRVKIRVKTWELPPRTRRIGKCSPKQMPMTGTTSAYAENTPPHHPKGSSYRELPPRTRRIQINTSIMVHYQGTTSAYAENTLNELGLL